MTDPYPTLHAMIATLAGLDPDRAHEQNGAGFSAADGAQGHRLARYARWDAPMAADAWDLIRHYRRTQLAHHDWAAAEDEAAGALAETYTGGLVAVATVAGRRTERRPQTPATPPPPPARPAPPAGGLDNEGAARRMLGPEGPIARSLPGYQARAPQLEGADLCEEAIVTGRHAVIEAGTGTGKSLMYLAAALATGKTALVSTADKGLQAQLATKDLPFLREHVDPDLRFVVMKGRQNYLCLERFDELRQKAGPDLFGESAVFRSPEAAAAWPALAEWATATTDGDLETAGVAVPGELVDLLTVGSDACIGDRCPFVADCFIERRKAQAKTAHVVVSNHALTLRDLALRAATDGHVGVLPATDVLILDEAHHLEDIATDAFGAELSAAAVDRFARSLARLTTEHAALRPLAPPPANATPDELARYTGTAERIAARQAVARRWTDEVAAVAARVDALIAACAERMPEQAATARIADETERARPIAAALSGLAERMRDNLPEWLDERGAARWGKLTRQADDLADRVIAVSVPAWDGEGATVRYAERVRGRTGDRIVLHAKPIDVSGVLRDALWQPERDPDGEDEGPARRTVIAASATIAVDGDMHHWRSRVGCDEALELIVGSPFDYRHHALLYLPAEGKAFEPARGDDAPAYLDRLADEIERLILASDGRAFVLFTARRTMLAVADRLAPRLRHTVMRQGDAPRPALIERFKADGRAVLFGLRSFWEGVDVAGDALSLVIIDKLPFSPPDDPVWDAKCEAVNRRRGDRWAWFDELAIPVATIALKQGFGRLIRTATDRGTVAILDGRLTTKGYGSRIIRSLPPATPTRSLDAVRAFYG